MFIIYNSNKEIVAICTREEDANAFTSASKIDKESYSVRNTNIFTEQEAHYHEREFIEFQDGQGEGQSL